MIDSNDEGLKEVSFVKMLELGEFIFDVLPEDVDLEIEEEISHKNHEVLNGYFRDRKRESIEGRQFFVGETVAVHINSTWRPAICTGLSVVSNNVIYEVLLMDSGQIIDVDLMCFRPFPYPLQMTSRFNSFVLLDILPVGLRARQLKLCWEADADEDIRLLFQLASRIFVEVIACYPLAGYNRLFGNVYLQMSTKMIDLKKHLLDSHWAFEDPAMFERIYQLKEEHFFNGKREHIPETTSDAPPCDPRVSSPLQREEITDETLDNYLPEYWKIGGTDPLTQVERETFRRRMMAESHIGFGATVQAKEKAKRKMEECSATEDASEDLRSHSTPQQRAGQSSECEASSSSFSVSKESELDDSGDSSKRESSSGNSVSLEEQNDRERKLCALRDKMRREFVVHYVQPKTPVSCVPPRSPSRSPNAETDVVRTPITDEARKKLMRFFKDPQETENLEQVESSLNELTVKDEECVSVVPSSVLQESSSSDSECIRKKEILGSPRGVQVDIPDETKQKILALFKS